MNPKNVMDRGVIGRMNIIDIEEISVLHLKFKQNRVLRGPHDLKIQGA